MTIGLTEPQEKYADLAEGGCVFEIDSSKDYPYDDFFKKMLPDEVHAILGEIDNDLAMLQDEINDMINAFVSAHKYGKHLEITAFDKTILKIKEYPEAPAGESRYDKWQELRHISPMFGEKNVKQQFVFLKPALLFEEGGGYGHKINRF